MGPGFLNQVPTLTGNSFWQIRTKNHLRDSEGISLRRRRPLCGHPDSYKEPRARLKCTYIHIYIYTRKYIRTHGQCLYIHLYTLYCHVRLDPWPAAGLSAASLPSPSPAGWVLAKRPRLGKQIGIRGTVSTDCGVLIMVS